MRTSNSSTSGENSGPWANSAWKTCRDRGDPRFFPPQVVVTVKRIACELPAQHDLPLSRFFIPDIREVLLSEKIVKEISTSTIWRILDEDALKPWRRRSWIWSRDPLFFERASDVLDLYQGIWRGRALRRDEFVISADEKTSIQARQRLHPPAMGKDGRGMRVEHEYERRGAWTYLAGLDVFQAQVMGRVELKNGIAPFDRLVDQIMRVEPYASARRVFWLVDQGSSHRPTTFPDRLRARHRNAQAVVLPVHSSWLNQIEIYFSILERKVLTPNDFACLSISAERIRAFEHIYNRKARPFTWRFTTHDLRLLLNDLPEVVLTEAARRHSRQRAVG